VLAESPICTPEDETIPAHAFMKELLPRHDGPVHELKLKTADKNVVEAACFPFSKVQNTIIIFAKICVSVVLILVQSIMQVLFATIITLLLLLHSKADSVL